MNPSTNGQLHDPQVCGLEEGTCPGCWTEQRDKNLALVRMTLDDVANHWKLPADDFAVVIACDLERILTEGKFAETVARKVRALTVKAELLREGFKVRIDKAGKWVLNGPIEKVTLAIRLLANEYRELNR